MKPSEEVAKQNPWYTSDQVCDQSRPHTRRTIANRMSFILAQMAQWRVGVTRLEPVTVLDAGCGDGVLLRELAEVTVVQCFGVDYNVLRVERARKNVPGAWIEQADLTKIELADGSLDAIVLNQVLEHIREDEVVLGRLVKALKPGGLFILGVPNEGCLLARLRNRVFSPSVGRTTDHVQFYTEKVIRRKLADNGLRVAGMMRENFFFPRQEISMLLLRFGWGYRFARFLGRVMPSQVAGVLFACEKVS